MGMTQVLSVFVVVCLLARHALASCNIQEYLNASSVCTPCTVCSSDGREEYSPCSANRDTVCYEPCPKGNFFDGTSCQRCSSCSDDPELITTPCSATNDTVCRECRPGYTVSAVGGCIVDCSKCASGECDSVNQCKCNDPCKTGVFCQDRVPGCGATQPPTDSSTTPSQSNASSETSSFSPVTSALVAVGAVMGIVIFSVLFVLLGVATSCRKGGVSGAESSNGSIDTHLGKASSSLTSLYANQSPSSLTDYRTSINFSNNSLNNSLAHSPRLGRPLSAASRNRDRVWTPV